jgi:hypothetical protein
MKKILFATLLLTFLFITVSAVYAFSITGKVVQISPTGMVVLSNSTRYEYYNTGDNTCQESWQANSYDAQTFTTSSSHPVNTIKLKLGRIWSSTDPGVITVSIKNTDSNGYPTGDSLCSGSFLGKNLALIYSATQTQWYTITLSNECQLNANTKYAIVVTAPQADVNNRLCWGVDSPDDGTNSNYNGGESVTDGIVGKYWDKMFELWYVQNVVQTCTDSDGGMNYYVKGNTTGIAFGTNYVSTLTDFCWPNGYGHDGAVSEWYCLNSTHMTNTSYICPKGCQDGACINSTISCGNGICEVGETCSNCPNDCGCSINQTCCSDGTCKNSCNAPTCTDSDGGINYYVKGKISGNVPPGYITEDICLAGNTLRETFCDLNDNNSDGYLGTSVLYSCPNGCQDGACVNVTSQTCAKEGEYIPVIPNGSSCCQGLVPISNVIYTPESANVQESCMPLAGSNVCTKCGDGICNATSGENKCNCPQDCQSNVSTCTDSDGGMNYYVKGTATSGSTTKTDQCNYCTGACLPGYPCNPTCGAVDEYYCKGNDIQSTTFICPNGCVDGACVNQTSTKVLQIRHSGNTSNPNAPGILEFGNISEMAYLAREGKEFVVKAQIEHYPNNLQYSLPFEPGMVEFDCSKYTDHASSFNLSQDYVGWIECNKQSYKTVNSPYDYADLWFWIPEASQYNGNIISASSKLYQNGKYLFDDSLFVPYAEVYIKSSSQTCNNGDTKNYKCSDGKYVDWCSCVNREWVCVNSPENGCINVTCNPECKFIGTRSEGWYDSCTGSLINYDNCACVAVCKQQGTDSEGWYNSCNGQLIKSGTCTQTSLAISATSGQMIQLTVNGKPVTVTQNTTQGTVDIKSEETATTTEKILVAENNISIPTTGGLKQVNYLPEDAKQKAIEAGNLVRVNSIELVKQNENVYYKVAGTRQYNILWIFPFYLDRTVTIDATTNEIAK